MATTLADISRWWEEGKRKGAKFLVVKCDTFDWSDYPVFCASDAECLSEIGEASGPGQYTLEGGMTKVMEVYEFSPELSEQLAEHRAWHPPAPKAETEEGE